MIRVLLVDDQHLIRAGLRMLCDAQPDIEVVGEADSGREAIPLAARLLPDVVVMDLRMPGVDGITATSRILAERPATRVLVLTTFGDDDHLYPALTAGACGFLLKDAPPTELLDGIRRAAVGDSPFSPEVLRRLVQRAVHARPGSPPALPGLTARERDVLNLVAEGLSNTEIADQLHIGVTTVKTHITSLMTKTDSPNRVRLALFARGV
ncbi:response regulator transcription factor [Micromonospora noduli]|uniref:Chemotaxis response regulator protein-glutamate methylesterase of group 1 operon n=1 Tax=Micromonospora noduli TaxID=709876 RepID=A0A328MVZ1_9ACTN|nr:response regulator transcription factor [Micromonospora noduli]KAB1928632.1 response regulator transcription factor [Micromonospora noduli]RAN93207.1 Chemotaxis response regulator protein-glutamate methylesterase of group 1 operon [Micromonospora noduli]RAO33242.1 Chemotaxis response regulator protein-glutamate methylesterase of group 1 operon [Micromonospora noduli]